MRRQPGPLGQAGTTARTWYEVGVGVIGSVRSLGLTRNSPYEFYRTIDQSSFGQMAVVIRTRGGDPATITPSRARSSPQSIRSSR